ncbi:MAG: hypothetical protein CSB47_03835, partial [Proteobacteria bacterium]
KGNSALPLTVSAKDNTGYLTRVEPRQLQLAPSDNAVITLTSTVPADLKKSLSHILKLSLHGQSVTEEKRISTQIISRTPEGTGLYHTLPTRIKANYVNEGDERHFQTELAVRGSLDEQGQHFIDALYRDTQANDISSLGGHSEQRISYQHNAFQLHLGDRIFPVAGITDDGFYGRGFEVGYQPIQQNWNIRAFTVEQHPDDKDDTDQAIKPDKQGFEVGYRHGEHLELTFNMIKSNTADNSQHEERLNGVEVYWDKYTAAAIHLSLAQDKDGRAFRFEQNGTLNNLSYDLEIERADTTFDGSISDIERQNFTGIYHINQKQSYFRTNLFHSKDNLGRDTTRRMTEEKNISLGFGHYLKKNNRDSVYVELFAKDIWDRRIESDLNQSEQGIRLDYLKNFSPELDLNATLEYLKTNNKLNSEASNKLRGSLTLAYTPSDNYHFGFNMDSLQTDTNATGASTDRLSYGFNATVNLGAGQRLSGYWRHSEYDDTASQNLQLNYHHTFRNRLKLGFSIASKLQQDESNELSYLLSLSTPMDVPLYKHNNIGSVSGKVIDLQSQQPIADTVVSLAGQYAVTDKNGNYRFQAVRAGNYQITTDLSRTTYRNHFMADAAHQEVTLIANRNTRHDINLAPGTGVSGRVVNYTAYHAPAIKAGIDVRHSPRQDTAKLRSGSGIGGVLVTLTSNENGTKKHKTLTNKEGYFHFNGISAGRWHIQASDPSGLIKEARLDKPLRTIELSTDKDQVITFRAIPLRSKIKRIGPRTGFTVSGD